VSAANRYRQLPSGPRSIGFELQAPSAVELERTGDRVRCSERRPDGKPVGELEVSVFRAALVIDRDGILEEKVRAACDNVATEGSRVLATIPVKLRGASGYRAEVELVRRSLAEPVPALPYVRVLAIAPNDLGVDGGVVVTVRCASPEWPAADQILRSLRLLGRNGGASANEESGPIAAPPLLPLIGDDD